MLSSPSFPADMDPDQPEPMRRISSEAKGKGRPLSTEASIIPGETEEDGMLRREYVLVGDTRAIEFNKTVDGKISIRLREIKRWINVCCQKLQQAGEGLRKAVSRRRPL